MSILTLEIKLYRGTCWDPVNTITFLCLSQAKIWISNGICRGLFFFLRSLIWVQIQFLYFFLKMQVIWYKEPISQLLTYTIGLFFVNRYVSRGAVITVINCVIIIPLIQLFLLSQDGSHIIWKWDSLITISKCEYYYFFLFLLFSK